MRTVRQVVASHARGLDLPGRLRPRNASPRRVHQSWLRHRQLVIGKRAPE